jgi:hypothetical protein
MRIRCCVHLFDPIERLVLVSPKIGDSGQMMTKLLLLSACHDADAGGRIFSENFFTWIFHLDGCYWLVAWWRVRLGRCLPL